MIFLLALAAAGPAFEDLAKLEARLVGALDAGIGQPGGPAQPIDRRLKLVRCPEPATIDPPALGAVALRCEAIGWRIRVPLDRSAQVQSVAVPMRATPVVKRGDPVEVRAEGAAFSVVGSAVADEDGAPGARIRVRTERTRPPFVAEVIDIGLVRVAGR